MAEDTITRVCVTCQLLKPLTAFRPRPKYGRMYYAHECNKCIQARRVYTTTPRPFVEPGMKICTECHLTLPLAEFGWKSERDNIRNSKCKPCQKLRNQRYDAIYHSRNREKRRNHRQDNRFRIAAYNGLKRAQQFNTNIIEEIDYDMIVARDQSICYLCLRLLSHNEISFDHVLALSRGGDHSADNVKVCCEPCNVRKHIKLLNEL